MRTITFGVQDISCGHYQAAIAADVGAVPGIERVVVDPESHS